MSYDMLRKCALITPDGRVARMEINLRDLGARDDILLHAVGEAAGVPIHHFCDVPNTNPPMKVHFYAAAQPGMAVRMEKLRFNTTWRLAEEGGKMIMLPTFGAPSPANNSINASLDWVPPQDMALYFVVRNSTCYLIALHQGEGSKWRAIRLNIPNLFEDARICMGNGWAMPDTGSAISRLSKCLDSFHNSQWNNHLLEGRAQDAERLLRFSADDGKCLPVVGKWWEYGQVVAGNSYNWLVAMASARQAAP